MRLFCMQHGASLSEELDPAQPLSPVGRESVRLSAAALAAQGLSFDAMIASPKERARQTAAIVARAVGYPERDILVSDSVKAMARPEETAEFLRGLGDAGQVFIAGHLPHLNRLVCHLLGAQRDLDLGIENSGLVCVESGLGSRPGRLLCLASASLLHALAGGAGPGSEE